jgi:large-conductance mechanosensitive channel
MLSFLVEEGILTVGTISGIFTAGMLNSFRMNVLEPCVENLIPSHKLDTDTSHFGGSLENIMALDTKDKPDPSRPKIVKIQTFLRDFITWIILVFFLYLFWKYVISKFKKG